MKMGKRVAGKRVISKIVWILIGIISLLSFEGFAHAQSIAASPVFNPASRQAAVGFPVTVTSITPGATIYYTTDGGTPTTSSSSVVSGGTITVSTSETITAMAVASGYANSSVATGIYLVTGAVAGGANHGVQVKSDGTVWTWGLNNNGQLGIGNTTFYTSPVQVPSLSGVTAVAAGYYHTLALKNDGTVWAWGINSNGELGDGTTTQRTSPVRVSGLTNVVAISAGTYHSIALKSDGTVWAWGSNSNGQLGDGTTTQRNVPVQVSGLSSITSISAGAYHNLAVNGSGNVYAWGYNSNGQLGDGTTTQHATAEQITSLSGIASVSAGAYHSLALTTSGNIEAWGLNGYGQIGDGTLTQRVTPVLIPGFSNVARICAGDYHNLAIKGDGTTWSWGFAWNGQCGVGTTVAPRSPMQMAMVNKAGALGTGASFSFVLDSNGNVKTCGYNPYGQLGTYEVDKYETPAPTLASLRVTALSANGNHSLALDSDGNAWAFGMNGNGQLGTNTTIQSGNPVKILSGIKIIGNGAFHSVAVKNDGTVLAWGEGFYGAVGDGTGRQRPLPTVVPGLTNVKTISVNNRQTLALKNDGTLWAWGVNTNGQLGDGTTTQQNSPVQVTGLSGVTIMAISEGQNHSLALDNAGRVWAWGANANGQLGDGTTTEKHAPEQISGFSGAPIVAISAGQNHSLALDGAGRIWAWGNNSNGQLGDGTTTQKNSPALNGLTAVLQVKAGDNCSFALKNNGTVWAWGANNYNQLGDGTVTQRNSPVQLSGLNNISYIVGGVGHSFAIQQSGVVYGWGANSWNALGTGSNESAIDYRWKVDPPAPTFQVAASGNFVQGQPLGIEVSGSGINSNVAKVTYSIAVSTPGGGFAEGYLAAGLDPAVNLGAVLTTHIGQDFGGRNVAIIATVTYQDGSTAKSFSPPFTLNPPPPNPSVAATPTFSPGTGTYTGNQTVTISSTTPGATIYYTIGYDGQPTTSNASVASGGTVTVPLSGKVNGIQQRLNAIAVAPGYDNSPVAMATYTLIVPAATPTFSLGAGSYGSSQVVTITSDTPGATIYYTTNGNTPTTNDSSIASGATVTVPVSETLKAIAIADGYTASAVASVNYTIQSAAPTFSLDGGTYLGAQTTTLSSSTPGATIYYTTNGTSPTTLSTSVTSGGSITIAQNSLVQAMAVALGYDNSPVSFAAYIITQPPPVAPSGLAVTGTSAGELDLNWANHASDATSVIVQQSSDGGATWTIVATLAGNATSYAATGLDTGTSYQFQVQASNGNGTSTSTNSGGGIHPPTTPQPPGAPTSLTGVTSDDPRGMSLSWPSVAGASSYLVERQYLATGQWETLTTVSSTTYVDTTYTGVGFHYRVSAISSDGTSSPSNEWPQSRYAIIDLGPSVIPMKITNSGYILTRSADSSSYQRWYNGTLTTLSPGASAYSVPSSPSSPKPPYWGDLAAINVSASPNTIVATSIGESGAVFGVQDWESINYHSFMTDYFLDTNGDGGYFQGYTGMDFYTCGYMCRAVWGPNASTATTTLVANATPWTSFGICGNSGEGENGSASMDAAQGLIGSDAATYSIESAKADPSGNSYKFDFFKNGSDQNKLGGTLGATNNSGDLLASFPGADYQEVGYLNGTPIPGNFSPESVSNRSSSGNGLIVPGYKSLSQTNESNPAWWDGQSGNINLLSTMGGWAASANAATVSVTSNGHTTQQPAPQIVGGDGLGSTLWEMDPSTSQFGPALHVSDLIGSGSQWAYVGASNLNDNGAIVGTATYSGTNTAIASGSHGVLLAPIEFVYETQKGSGVFKTLDKLPIFQPDTGVGETSTSASTYGVYELQLTVNITTSAVASMNVYFANASGTSFTGTLTETAANSGVFHDAASTVTLTLPVGTTTSSTAIDTLTATVTDSALGLSGVSMTFQENAVNSLVFTQPHMDMAVGFPSGGLSTSAVDTITLEYTTNEVATDVTLTETGANTDVFHSSDGTISLSIVGTPSFNPSAVDTMQIQLTASGLFPGTIACQLNETGANTCIFSNFSITYGDNTPVDPGASDDGVFYVRLHGFSLPAGQTMNMSVCAGADPNITGSTPTGANYVQSSRLLLVPPGNGTPSYTGITTVAMDSVTTLVNFGFMGQVAQFTKKAAPTAFLTTGALGSATVKAFPSGITPQNHLETLDQIIGRKKYTGVFDWTGKPPVLGYANSVTQTDLTLTKLKSEVGNNHSIFYILTHSTGAHETGGGMDNSRFIGFNVWKTGYLWNTPYPVTSSDITGSINGDVYDLVFINGCCSANDSDGMATAYKNAFNAHAYVGWDVAVLLDSCVQPGVDFFNALAGGTTVRKATDGLKATEAGTSESLYFQTYGQTAMDAKFDDGVIIDKNAPPASTDP